MQPKNVALRKRSMIASANRTMFIWVAAVSVVFGVVLVASIFLVQILMFNERVLIEKNKTVSTLKYNNQHVDGLKKNIKQLNFNQALIDAKASPDDEALQVVLDALPSKANSPALGASLQDKLLAGIDLNKIQVNQVDGIETLNDDTAVVEALTDGEQSSNEINFTFSVIGTQAELKQVLINLEKSIRTIDIISLRIENQGTKQEMTVIGRGFYEPERVVKLIDKVIK